MHKVLIVDDSRSQRQMVAHFLKQFEFRVGLARDGQDALQKIQDYRPDLVLLDVVMPGMNGYELCRQLKRHPETRDIQVVFFSSNSSESDRHWGLKMGAAAYVAKPCRPQQLLNVVNDVLKNKHRKRFKLKGSEDTTAQL